MALRPRASEWPFSGTFYGFGPQLSWAGCVGSGTDPLKDWHNASRFRARLSQLQGFRGDNKVAIATFFSVLSREQGQGQGEEELSVLVAASDHTGVAVSGFGFHAILATEHPGATEVWLEGEHPMLSLPGWPTQPMGAIVLERVPKWLIGVLHPADDGWKGTLSDQLLPECGVIL